MDKKQAIKIINIINDGLSDHYYYEIKDNEIYYKPINNKELIKGIRDLKNEDYDLIYVDGNHEPYAVLEDLVLCFRKCKYGGYIVIDDYEFNCTSSTATKIGIDGFLKAYKMKIKIIQIANGQVYLQKI
jgi:predicted O-methyltransferase YrrM